MLSRPYFAILLCSSILHVHALTRQQHRIRQQVQRSADSTQTNNTDPYEYGETTLPDEYVNLPIDHFGGHPGTFGNRFWVVEDLYKTGSPIFVFDSGESDASSDVYETLQNDSSVSRQMLNEFNGMGIVWEHRYYGNSLPFNSSNDTGILTAEQYQYLTIEQALADVAVFAQNFSRSNFTSVNLTSSYVPWIFVGGSYSGARAAWMRNIYPDVIFASYASSAPVEAKVDLSEYNEQCYLGVNAYGFGNCTQDVKAVIAGVDAIMGGTNASAATALKEQFLGIYGNDTDTADHTNAFFAQALTNDFPGFFQWYGIEDYEAGVGLRSFCDWMSTDPESNQTSGAEGWASTKGVEWSINQWASYPGLYCADGYCEGSDDQLSDPDDIAWMWQYCTQFGFFQSANLGPNQIVSKYYSIPFLASMCQQQFPDAGPSLLPALPAADTTNAQLGGWTIRPSNVYWSSGEFDPWRPLTPLSNETYSPDYALTETAPSCNSNSSETTDNGKQAGSVFGYLIPDAEHAFDLDSEYFEVAENRSRQDFTGALQSWLPCFKPGEKGSSTSTSSTSSSTTTPQKSSAAGRDGGVLRSLVALVMVFIFLLGD